MSCKSHIFCHACGTPHIFCPGCGGRMNVIHHDRNDMVKNDLKVQRAVRKPTCSHNHKAVPFIENNKEDDDAKEAHEPLPVDVAVKSPTNAKYEEAPQRSHDDQDAHDVVSNQADLSEDDISSEPDVNSPRDESETPAKEELDTNISDEEDANEPQLAAVDITEEDDESGSEEEEEDDEIIELSGSTEEDDHVYGRDHDDEKEKEPEEEDGNVYGRDHDDAVNDTEEEDDDEVLNDMDTDFKVDVIDDEKEKEHLKDAGTFTANAAIISQEGEEEHLHQATKEEVVDSPSPESPLPSPPKQNVKKKNSKKAVKKKVKKPPVSKYEKKMKTLYEVKSLRERAFKVMCDENSNIDFQALYDYIAHFGKMKPSVHFVRAFLDHMRPNVHNVVSFSKFVKAVDEDGDVIAAYNRFKEYH